VKHTFSAEDKLFESVESLTEHLCDGSTPKQRQTVQQAIEAYWQYRDEPTIYPDPLHDACQLKSMRADVPTLVSTMLGNDVMGREVSLEHINEKFGADIADLTRHSRCKWAWCSRSGGTTATHGTDHG